MCAFELFDRTYDASWVGVVRVASLQTLNPSGARERLDASVATIDAYSVRCSNLSAFRPSTH